MKMQGLLEDWLELQGVPLIPNQRKALWQARWNWSRKHRQSKRTFISNLVTQVQDNVVRDRIERLFARGSARALR